jgi:hypothetical protein
MKQKPSSGRRNSIVVLRYRSRTESRQLPPEPSICVLAPCAASRACGLSGSCHWPVLSSGRGSDAAVRGEKLKGGQLLLQQQPSPFPNACTIRSFRSRDAQRDGRNPAAPLVRQVRSDALA